MKFTKTNYNQGIIESEKSSKPTLILFTGPGWCPWCVKLEELFNLHTDLNDLFINKTFFIEAALPKKKDEEKAETDCSNGACNLPLPNSGLRKKYAIMSLPTLLLLDSNKNEVTRTEYLDTKEEYIDWLHSGIETIESNKFSEVEDDEL